MQWTDALEDFARFAAAFASDGFVASTVHEPEEIEPGVMTMPWWEYSDVVSEWHQALYEHGVIDAQGDYLSIGALTERPICRGDRHIKQSSEKPLGFDLQNELRFLIGTRRLDGSESSNLQGKSLSESRPERNMLHRLASGARANDADHSHQRPF